MGFIKEFKEFISRGNVIDLAVGIIIGAAFGQITNSLVNDLIMPPLGLLIAGVDFTNLKVVLKAAEEGKEAVTMNYGLFLQTLLNFLIIAFAVFIIIKAINRFREKKAEQPADVAPTNEELLLSEIRDLLKQGAMNR